MADEPKEVTSPIQGFILGLKPTRTGVFNFDASAIEQSLDLLPAFWREKASRIALLLNDRERNQPLEELAEDMRNIGKIDRADEFTFQTHLRESVDTIFPPGDMTEKAGAYMAKFRQLFNQIALAELKQTVDEKNFASLFQTFIKNLKDPQIYCDITNPHKENHTIPLIIRRSIIQTLSTLYPIKQVQEMQKSTLQQNKVSRLGRIGTRLTNAPALTGGE